MKTVLHSTVMLLRWGESNASGPTVTFLLNDPDDLEFFRGATTKRHGHAGQMYALALVEYDPDNEGDGEPPAAPETSAARDLVDSAQAGYVTDDGAHVIIPTVDKDGSVTSVEIRDHKHHYPNGLTGLAVLWAKLPDHWQWLESEFGIPVADEATAKDLVCSITGVESRTEFGTNPEAAATFVREIKEPYSASRRERGLDA
jgi:hypothetical protein